ncbi:MAG: cobaltochelatase subunit CobN [Pseudomonadota bacterium]
MHLLTAQQGSLGDTDEAIDLGQSPGDILFVSAADTELSSLASAQRGRDSDALTLRLANMMKLSHPMSVDVYAEQTVAHAKLIILRCLGGASYWQYGLEKLYETACDNDIAMVALPGDDKPDATLDPFNRIDDEQRLALWSYLIEGGAQNSAHFLDYCASLVENRDLPPPAAPLLKSGLYLPNIAAPTVDDLGEGHVPGAPTVAICFYRALVQSGNLEPVDALISALRARNLNVLPVFVSSLKDPVSVATLETLFETAKPDVILNLTGFAVSGPGQPHAGTVLDRTGATVFQTVLSATTLDAWQESAQGLPARDLAMNIALPEIDGRVFSRAIAFKDTSNFDERTECALVAHKPLADRVGYVADLAKAWADLRRKTVGEKKVGLILANYPNRDGRLGNGVGLDTPAGTVNVLKAMASRGYNTGDLPADGCALMDLVQTGPTNAAHDGREVRETLSSNDYNDFFGSLPVEIQDEVTARWGSPETDPFFMKDAGAFALPLMRFGNVAVGVQPARGYNIDPKESYHSPDLVPPHGYFAFYGWLRRQFRVDAIAHMGKHGNLEWLPGKALSPSTTCYPEATLGAVPHLYPFIVNDPGEGTQAKRRTSAVIIDHLTPPLTRAESHGPLKDLEALVDEYYEASGGDRRRLKHLKTQILDLVRDIGLDEDAGIAADDADSDALEKLDAHLCDLKEMQIRDGLHIFGASPEGRLKTDLVTALARIPRGLGEGRDQSLQRAIAHDFGFADFDPLDCDFSAPWGVERPDALQAISNDQWRSCGDAVERIEVFASGLVSGEIECPAEFDRTRDVLSGIKDSVEPAVALCGKREIDGFLTALSGYFVSPGPSGAPTRGRLDVLPTGRNFYSVDSRSIPTQAAWYLGQKSADLLLKRHRQEHGEWPKALGLSAWGTSNMRTGGDDIAQAMALIGARPVWEPTSRRVTGYEIITLAELGRPRIDVTLRISGFFRDAFPQQINLFDQAVAAIAALEEDEADNPISAAVAREAAAKIAQGMDADLAKRQAGHRIFGSKPGAYGAGLQALIDEKGWANRGDLAEAYLQWGAFAYGVKSDGDAARDALESRLGALDAIVHNQDNREHDLLDSDDYYQFEGGMAAAAEHVSGARPTIYHNDHSRPERPVIRTLEEEIGRVVRGRVTNPKWISGVMRHGYKGAFEIAATVDYLFAFSATTGAVRDHHFDAVYRAFVADDSVREFMADKNPAALKELCDRLLEALDRDLWTARSNSARFDLEQLARA